MYDLGRLEGDQILAQQEEGKVSITWNADEDHSNRCHHAAFNLPQGMLEHRDR